MTTKPAPDIGALVRAAEAELRLRNSTAALELLARAEAAAPADIPVKMLKASALRLAGDLPGALAALEGVLTQDP